MAQDTRRDAVSGLPTQCSCRGHICLRRGNIAQRIAFDFVSGEISKIAQVTSNQEELTVAVTFHIPGALREFTDGRSKVEIEPSPGTLADALSALWTLYPGVRDHITTEQGQVREHINIFIGDEDIRYTGGLATPVPAGSEISIVPAVSGGIIHTSHRTHRAASSRETTPTSYANHTSCFGDPAAIPRHCRTHRTINSFEQDSAASRLTIGRAEAETLLQLSLGE